MGELSGRYNARFQYRIAACNTAGCSHYRDSEIIGGQISNGSVPAIPADITAPPSDRDGSYIVSWSAVTGATKYELQRKVGTGGWTLVQAEPLPVTQKRGCCRRTTVTEFAAVIRPVAVAGAAQ